MNRILIIDQDILARRAIAKMLQKNGNYQLIIDGDISKALASITSAEPDLLLLGIDAEQVEEIALLSTIIRQFPTLPVIMVTERSRAGAALAIAALRLGAIDFITKPNDCNTLLFAEQHFKKRVLPIVESALKVKRKAVSLSRYSAVSSRLKGLKSMWPLNLVVIGGCTGAPAALFELMESLPVEFSTPVVIAQHMPRYYTSVLAQRLDEISEHTVQEAADGAEILPGTVWIAPGGYHTEVYRESNKTVMKVHRGPRENGVRPSIDLLFRSAARLYGPGTLGVILSGGGIDGVAGTATVKQANGHVVAQDFRTALVPDLPLSIIAAGYHDLISPIEHMADIFLFRENGVARTAEQSDSSDGRNSVQKNHVGYRRINRMLFNTM